MAECVLSSLAEADLSEIAEYTIENFGIKQARRYRDGLESRFQTLANNPFIGRSADDLAPQLRYLEYQSHNIFYLPQTQKNNVLIVRVLHASMNAERRLDDT